MCPRTGESRSIERRHYLRLDLPGEKLARTLASPLGDDFSPESLGEDERSWWIGTIHDDVGVRRRVLFVGHGSPSMTTTAVEGALAGGTGDVAVLPLVDGAVSQRCRLLLGARRGVLLVAATDLYSWSAPGRLRLKGSPLRPLAPAATPGAPLVDVTAMTIAFDGKVADLRGKRTLFNLARLILARPGVSVTHSQMTSKPNGPWPGGPIDDDKVKNAVGRLKQCLKVLPRIADALHTYSAGNERVAAIRWPLEIGPGLDRD